MTSGRPPPPPVAGGPEQNRSTKSLSGKRILIVEDEFFLALELEDYLRAAGADTVGPCSDLASAVAASRREPVDLAVLDVNLNGTMVYPLADELLARGLPFVFVTGYSAANLPERFRESPLVTKPYDPAALVRIVTAVAAAAMTRR